jgi:hypothetical protein
MITEISKNIDKDTGLPISIKRTGYWHNEEAQCIEIYFQKYITYPNGVKVRLGDEKRLIVQDTPAIAAVPESTATGLGGQTITISAQAAVPANTDYTDYCKQFNADAIGAAIDDFLTNKLTL